MFLQLRFITLNVRTSIHAALRSKQIAWESNTHQDSNLQPLPLDHGAFSLFYHQLIMLGIKAKDVLKLSQKINSLLVFLHNK